MASSPKYMDIVRWTKGQIFDQAFIPGERFLSESSLCQKFSVSRQTVRRAMEVLAQEGHVQRVQGSGTYIAGATEAFIRPAAHENSAMTIGVISLNIHDYIFPGIIRGIEGVLTQSGYAVQLASTQDDVASETRALERMLDSQPAGLIIEPTKSGLPCLNLELYRAVFQRGIPVVFTDSRYPEVNAPSISLDDDKVGYAATRHLLDMGHRQIAGIFTHTNRSGLLRYRGYVKALHEAGLPLRDDRVHWYRHENMQEMLHGGLLWASLSACTAVVCFNDQLAIRLMNLLQKHGLRVPEDISIVGTDNTELASISALTSIVHPMERLGEAAAQMLLSMIGGAKGEDVLFAPELISRGSVRRLEKAP